MTDDCVWEVTRGREPHGTLYTGRAGVRSAITEGFKALPDVKYQPVRNSFGEDHVVVELLVTGTLGDGSKARFHARDILTLRDGLIAAKRSYLAAKLLGKAQESRDIEDDLICILYLAFRCGFKTAIGNNRISTSE
jgi:ketosteroid isomerase-like protein